MFYHLKLQNCFKILQEKLSVIKIIFKCLVLRMEDEKGETDLNLNHNLIYFSSIFSLENPNGTSIYDGQLKKWLKLKLDSFWTVLTDDEICGSPTTGAGPLGRTTFVVNGTVNRVLNQQSFRASENVSHGHVSSKHKQHREKRWLSFILWEFLHFAMSDVFVGHISCLLLINIFAHHGSWLCQPKFFYKILGFL